MLMLKVETMMRRYLVPAKDIVRVCALPELFVLQVNEEALPERVVMDGIAYRLALLPGAVGVKLQRGSRLLIPKHAPETAILCDMATELTVLKNDIQNGTVLDGFYHELLSLDGAVAHE